MAFRAGEAGRTTDKLGGNSSSLVLFEITGIEEEWTVKWEGDSMELKE